MSIYRSFRIQRFFYLKFGKAGNAFAYCLKALNRIINAADISYKAEIGKECEFPHRGLGIVIGDKVVIGDNCIIRQNVTIGGKGTTDEFKCPKIGDNCMIGAGAVIIGGITIGNNVQIGANAVVTKNLPDNVVAVGVPAVIVKNNGAI